MSILQLDHLVLAVPNLQDAIAFFQETLGIKAAKGGRHIGNGTHNALIGLGKPADNTYLELFAIDPEDQTLRAHYPLGLKKSMGAPYVASWCIRCTPEIDIFTINKKMRELGEMYALGEVKRMERTSQEGSVISWKIASTSDQALASEGHIPFLIQWDDLTNHPTSRIPEEDFCNYLLSFSRPDYETHKTNLQSIGVKIPEFLEFTFSKEPSTDLTLFSRNSRLTFHKNSDSPNQSPN